MNRDYSLDRIPPPVPIATREILGGGGLKLHAREWGNPEGPPLLFIHGWSQSDLCWLNQVRGDLAGTSRIVTFDLRGHGLSDKPPAPEHYASGQLWADDVAAVIDQAGLEQPILVAWSYGGYIVADYLRAYGDAHIGGINLVGAATILRPPAFDHIGPGLLENAQGMCVPDLFANIAATRRFLRACTSRPLGDDELAAALAWNMVVPSAVRRPPSAVRRPRRAALARARRQRHPRARVGSRARDTRARRRDRAAFDGRTYAHRLPGRDRVVVRRRRSHAVLGGARSLRPRTRRPRTRGEITTARTTWPPIADRGARQRRFRPEGPISSLPAAIRKSIRAPRSDFRAACRLLADRNRGWQRALPPRASRHMRADDKSLSPVLVDITAR